MATLNLGRIKPVFKGAWTSGAYVIDDIVTHGNETFICIQAGTNIATTNASYWSKLASKGADGTDVGTTLTTQGDILYRDGSGLQRLGAGTSGQVLQTGGAGANPSWGTVSSDFVKIGSGTSGSASTHSISFQNDAYKTYQVVIRGFKGNGNVRMRLIDGSNNVITASHYSYVTDGRGTSSSNSGDEQSQNFNNDTWVFTDGSNNTSYKFTDMIFWFHNFGETNQYKSVMGFINYWDGTGWWEARHVHGTYASNEGSKINGFNLYGHNGNTEILNYEVYGLK